MSVDSENSKLASDQELIHRQTPSCDMPAARNSGGIDSGGMKGNLMAQFSAYKALLSPVLFAFDPERVHHAVVGVLPAIPSFAGEPDPILRSEVAGLEFPSPVGLAAGFDKDAKCFKHAFRLGFGAVEIGTLTPRPQAGNSGKRIYRLTKDRAVINRMGFPNCGIPNALPRLQSFAVRPGPLGVNIGANKDTDDKIADYVEGFKQVSDVSDYVTINISSPNTPGLRKFENAGYLGELIDRISSATFGSKTPIFLKVSPDLEDYQISEVCSTIRSSPISALIIGNTTIRRPSNLLSKQVPLEGGLSGVPLRPFSVEALTKFRTHLKNELPIVSVGGISNATDVYQRIRLGASLVQLYTSFIYEGPGLVSKINRDLAKLLRNDGFNSISEAIGVDSDNKIAASQLPIETYPTHADAGAVLAK